MACKTTGLKNNTHEIQLIHQRDEYGLKQFMDIYVEKQVAF